MLKCKELNCMCECDGDTCDTNDVEDHCNVVSSGEYRSVHAEKKLVKEGTEYAAGEAGPSSRLEHLPAAYGIRAKKQKLSPLSARATHKLPVAARCGQGKPESARKIKSLPVSKRCKAGRQFLITLSFKCKLYTELCEDIY